MTDSDVPVSSPKFRLIASGRKIKEVPYEEIQDLFNKAKTIIVTDRLICMQKEVSNLHHNWLRSSVGICQLDSGRSFDSPYSNVLSFIAERITLLNPGFELNPEISNTENVNGYQLYDCKGNFLCYSDFVELQLLFNDDSNKTMEFDEFYTLFDSQACTEWSKMNVTGDDWYVGFWKAEEGTEEKENAWCLTREQNARALFDLPYSKTFLLKTVEHGCSCRMESVRYSNFMGVWFDRKLKLMNSCGYIVDEEALNNQYETFMSNYYASLYPKIFVDSHKIQNAWFQQIEGKWVNTEK